MSPIFIIVCPGACAQRWLGDRNERLEVRLVRVDPEGGRRADDFGRIRRLLRDVHDRAARGHHRFWLAFEGESHFAIYHHEKLARVRMHARGDLRAGRTRVVGRVEILVFDDDFGPVCLPFVPRLQLGQLDVHLVPAELAGFVLVDPPLARRRSSSGGGLLHRPGAALLSKDRRRAQAQSQNSSSGHCDVQACHRELLGIRMDCLDGECRRYHELIAAESSGAWAAPTRDPRARDAWDTAPAAPS